MKADSRITFALFSHERQNLMRKQIAYLLSEISSCGFSADLIVLDSSAEPLEMESNTKFRYFHMPSVSLPKKLAVGLSQIETQYFMLVADDDVVVLETVEQCCVTLDSEPLLSAVGGSIWEHKCSVETNFAWPEGVHRECAPGWAQKAATHSDMTPALDGLGLMVEYSVIRRSAVLAWIDCLWLLEDITAWQFLLGFNLRCNGGHMNLAPPIISRDVEAYTVYQREYTEDSQVTSSFVWDSGIYILSEKNYAAVLILIRDWATNLASHHEAKIVYEILGRSINFFNKKRIRSLKSRHLRQIFRRINSKILYSRFFRFISFGRIWFNGNCTVYDLSKFHQQVLKCLEKYQQSRF